MGKTKYEVDFHKTGMHGYAMGVRQKQQHMSKSRQFSKDLDIYGEVKRDGESIGFVGIRENAWKDDELSQRRLILKYFSKTMNWKGTMELMVGRSIVNSIVMESPAPVFTINLPRHDFLMDLRRIRPAKMNPGLNFGLELIDEEKLSVIQFDDKRLRPGDDFTIKTGKGKKVGDIDSKVLNIGGKVDFKIEEESLEIHGLESCTVLFVAMLRWKSDLDDLIEKQIKAYEKGELGKLDNHELDAMTNPRRPVM